MVEGWTATSDLASFRAFQRLEQGRGHAVSVRLRALDGIPVKLRPGTTDRSVALATFSPPFAHRPPADLRPQLIVDVGANIGLTMVDLAVLHPTARIIGVEPDPSNAGLARDNVSPFQDRCDVVTAAVWIEDGTVPFQSQPGAEWTSRIDRGDHGSEWSSREVRSVSLNSLVDSAGHVDYLKLDIEGAEKEVLGSDCAWAAHVDCINVEVHVSHYPLSECLADLQKIGFGTTVRDEVVGGVSHVVGRRLPG
jgi:FkbM family methyltransferase